jgi:multidrug efflux pump subunit AcrB
VEARLRELPEIKNIVTTIHPGSAIVQISAYDNVRDLNALWQRARAKVAEASGSLPEGTLGPYVDDDFGRVVVASVAVTAPGFTMSEMREPIKHAREQLYTLSGVDKVSIHGLQEERVYVEFHRDRLAGLGMTPEAVLQQLQAQNMVVPGGEPLLGGLTSTVDISGNLRTVDELRRFLVAVPGHADGAEAPLSSLAEIKVIPADPPESAAIYKGNPAVVMAVSMSAGQNVVQFGATLRVRLKAIEQQLPIGFSLHVVSFQADVVEREMHKMNHVMLETVIIVMAVVMLFLGWRTGLVVGSIVPLTILGSLILMRALGIELQTVSIAAIILALGLLVDNGIVIAEDIERRLRAGEQRRQACQEAGRTLAIPLLTSSLVIVLGFSPFFLGRTSTNEYLRSLPIVLTLTLLGSWLLSLTVTPLLCYHFAKIHPTREDGSDAHVSQFDHSYRRLIEALLEHKAAYISAMLVLLAIALAILATVPYDFLPKSDRLQFQAPLQLQPGSDSRKTLETVKDVSRWLADERVNPEVVDSIGYVADGGPRIVLGLDPALPAPNVAYFTVSVKPGSKIDAVIERMRRYLLAQHPEVRAEPKRFSLGGTESGVVAYRIVGGDEAELRAAAERIESALRALPGTEDIHDDWSTRIPQFDVQVDQANARKMNSGSRDIALALQTRYSGTPASAIRDDDTLVPIVLRGSDAERNSKEDVASTLVYPATGGMPVALSAVAKMAIKSEPSTIRRRNLSRVITVEAHNASLTAQSIVDRLAPQVAQIKLPTGYRIELGGEVEDSAEANQALLQYLPHALLAMLLLFVWQFNSFRKLAIVVASIPFILIGVAAALKLTGYPLGFMATFGLLSLAGIIVNNAVLLLDRIETEIANGHPLRRAVANAAVRRLRPIVMTKLTCIVGLIPLMLFAGPLWTGMSITIMGGLALGTLVTLGLIPVLYELLFANTWMRRQNVLRPGD